MAVRDAFVADPPRIGPPIDRELLTRSHVLLCALEKELREAGRGEESDLLGYVDLLVLLLRNSIKQRAPF